MKVGLYGGTFDPFHLGHLSLASQAILQIPCDKIIFIPTFLSPHKADEKPIEVRHRLAMLRLGIEGEKRFEISDYEIRQKQICFTIDTVRALKKENPGWKEVSFLIGSDSLGKIASWKEFESLKKEVRWVVGKRPGFEIDKLPFEAKILTNTLMPEASREIRAMLRCGEEVSAMLPKKVWDYIVAEKLYGVTVSK